MSIPTIKLAEQHHIPQLGLGLWQVQDQAQFDAAFKAAVENGYRHFDTAQIYHNEQFLGVAWSNSGIARKDLFITTKVWIANFTAGRLKKSVSESLNKLQTDYIDLLLLHFPVTVLRKHAWQSLEQLQKEGVVKSIGVSNYTVRHLKQIRRYSKQLPVVNQVELHLFLQQPELVKYCRENNIIIEAYSPLAHAKDMHNPTVQAIADKHHKSYAQIMLRWLVEQDMIVLPKSVNPKRIIENADIFDFSLDEKDLAQLARLDRNLRTCWSPVHVP